MKIISGNDCYVQRSDLEYLIDNTSKVSSDLYRFIFIIWNIWIF